MAFSGHIASPHLAKIWNMVIMGGMVVMTLNSHRRSPDSIPHRSQLIGPNIFILSESHQHPFSVVLGVHKSSFHHVGTSNVQPCNRFQFSHTSFPLAKTASHFVHSPSEQLMPRKCIFAVLWKNWIIKSSMHQIFVNMRSTVSTAPSFMVSLMGISHAPHPLTVFPHILRQNLLFCLSYLLFFHYNPQDNWKANS